MDKEKMPFELWEQASELCQDPLKLRRLLEIMEEEVKKAVLSDPNIVEIDPDAELPNIIKRADWDSPLTDDEYATLIQLDMESAGWVKKKEKK